MEKHELVILLGSQIQQGTHTHQEYLLARHTELKALGGVIAYKQGVTSRFIISGGHNFGVRYDKTSILPHPDFSLEAFTQARDKPSEAEIIRGFMEKRGVPREAMFLEEISSYTQEQAEILAIVLERSAFQGMKEIGLLTLAYHMKRALLMFVKEFTNLKVKLKPLFAEDLLVLRENGLKIVCQYYSTPKGGEQWDTDKIRELLSNGKSIGELLSI